MSNEVPLNCYFDGNFHAVEGKACYSGGTTRNIRVDRRITYMDLLSKLAQKCRNPISSSLQVTYKYPGYSLDSNLIDIYDDEDVCNMMKAFKDRSSYCPLELYISTKLADTSTLVSIPANLARSLQKEANVSNKGAILQRGGTSTACLPIPENDAIQPPEEIRIELDNQGSQDTSHVPSQSSRSILKEGLEFPNLDSLKIAVREASILGHFKIKTKRTDSKHYRVECADENCSWHMHAVWVGESCFRIRSLKEEHKCSRTPGQATQKWIAKFTRDHRMENAETKQIMKEINTRHGMDVDYHQARRGKLLASKEIRKDQSESVATVGGGKRARMSKHLESGKDCAVETNGSREQILEQSTSPETLMGCDSGSYPMMSKDQLEKELLVHQRSDAVSSMVYGCVGTISSPWQKQKQKQKLNDELQKQMQVGVELQKQMLSDNELQKLNDDVFQKLVNGESKLLLVNDELKLKLEKLLLLVNDELKLKLEKLLLQVNEELKLEKLLLQLNEELKLEKLLLKLEKLLLQLNEELKLEKLLLQVNEKLLLQVNEELKLEKLLLQVNEELMLQRKQVYDELMLQRKQVYDELMLQRKQTQQVYDELMLQRKQVYDELMLQELMEFMLQRKQVYDKFMELMEFMLQRKQVYDELMLQTKQTQQVYDELMELRWKKKLLLQVNPKVHGVDGVYVAEEAGL